MRVGINEVLIYNRASGARQRELNLLPEVLRQLECIGAESVVYVSRSLKDDIIMRLIGDNNKTKVVKVPISSVPTYQRILKGILYWQRQVVNDNLDVFHTAYYPVPRVKLPTILTVHDLRFLHMPETYHRARYWFLRVSVPYSLAVATRIVTVSNNTKDDMINYYGIPSEKIDVSYNPISSNFLKPDSDIKSIEIKDRLKLPDKFILYVGNLEPRKNLDRLLQAFILVRQKLNYKLVILGKAEWGTNILFDIVKQNHLEKEVLFTGYLEEYDLSSVYRLASLLAFPSLHEGFGIPVIEAMACGVPVLTSNVSALPEVAGDAAILVDPYSVESIANGILAILSDEKLRYRLIKRGFERIKLFSREKSAKVIVESYQKAFTDTSDFRSGIMRNAYKLFRS